jgi:phosphotriesterase-related protein
LLVEHIFLVDPAMEINWPSQPSHAQRIEDALAKLETAKQCGVDTIMDRTTIGTGRAIGPVREVAERSPVNIIVTTGFYTWNDLPLYFLFRESLPIFAGRPERMEDYFVRDIEDGIGESGVRAAAIKCATDAPGITAGVEASLRAAARAHRRTGAPIHTHTNGALTGLEQQRVLSDEGVDLGRVLIGHIDRSPSADLEAIEQLMVAGSFVGFDSFGFLPGVAPPMESAETRMDWISDFCARGYADRIVLSHDQTAYTDLLPAEVRERTHAELGTYTWWANVGLAGLRERGVDEAQIHQMTVANPRRFFESLGRGGY